MLEMENLDKRKFTTHFINRSIQQHKFSKVHRIQGLRNYSNSWLELDWTRKIKFVAVETRWEIRGSQKRKEFMFLDCTGTFLLLPISQEGWWVKGEEFMRKHLDPNPGKTGFAPGPLNLELSTSCKKVCFIPPAQQKGTGGVWVSIVHRDLIYFSFLLLIIFQDEKIKFIMTNSKKELCGDVWAGRYNSN